MFTCIGITDIGITDIAMICALAIPNTTEVVVAWEIETGKQVFSIKTETKFLDFSGETKLTVDGLAFSPDGKRLAGACRDGVRLWDFPAGTTVLTLPRSATSVAYSPDGKLLAAASSDGAVRLWDPTAAKEVRALTWHAGKSTALAFRPDGLRLATAEDKAVRVWEVADGKLTLTIDGAGQPLSESVTFTPDGRRLVTVGDDDRIRVWNAADGQRLHVFAADRFTYNAVVSPDGKLLACGGGGGRSPGGAKGNVQIRTVDDGCLLHGLAGHRGIIKARFTPDGKCVVSAAWDRSIRVWDTATGKLVREIKIDGHCVRDIAVSPDGRYAAVAQYLPGFIP